MGLSEPHSKRGVGGSSRQDALSRCSRQMQTDAKLHKLGGAMTVWL